MERGLWRQNYGYFPQFTCPTCRKGKLKRTVKEPDRREPKHITLELQEEQLQGEVSEGRFVLMMMCDQKICGELVAIAGDYRSDANVDYGENGELQTFESIEFQPKSVHRRLRDYLAENPRENTHRPSHLVV